MNGTIMKHTDISPITHSDDEAVIKFSEAMRAKLKQKREEGRGGWEGCDPSELAEMLLEHLEKGDPVDIANFAMFLYFANDGAKYIAEERRLECELADKRYHKASELLEEMREKERERCVEIAHLEFSNKHLRKALKPFAAWARRFDGRQWNRHFVKIFNSCGGWDLMKVDDFRQARALTEREDQG